MDDARSIARRRALRAAVVVTLGLVAGASAGGCDRVASAGCEVFENNRFCCERAYGAWDPASRTCVPPIPVPGPFVPPDLPA